MDWNWLIGIFEPFCFVYPPIVDLRMSDAGVEQIVVEKLEEAENFVSSRNKGSCPGPPVGL